MSAKEPGERASEPMEMAVDLAPPLAGVSALILKGRQQILRPHCYTELLYSPTLFRERQLYLALGRQGRVYASEEKLWSLVFNLSIVLRQSQQCRRNTGRQHIFRDPPPTPCQ